MIDNFNAPASPFQYVCKGDPLTCGVGGTNQSNPTSGLALTDTAGGTRLLTVVTPPSGFVTALVNGAGNATGKLNISSDPNADPDVTVSYTGLASNPANLVAGGANLLHMKYWSDLGFGVTATFNGVSVVFTLPSSGGASNGPGVDFYMPLSAWSNVATFTSVTSASFRFAGATGSSADGWFDLIETNTPEPMTFAMMGAGLLALGALRLRKRA
jgi:hypothetical protein